MEQIQFILSQISEHGLSELMVGAAIALLIIAFVLGFLLPWFVVRLRIKAFGRSVAESKASGQADPKQIAVKDPDLKHLWTQFSETLHLPQTARNPRTGIAQGSNYRATVPAEAIFNAPSVYESRIHSEFFKHLPGLLTGLGIIGTFYGLISGLGGAFENGQLNPAKLIDSVHGAFKISAVAITAAMVITFLEKCCIANLHRSVDALCRQIDSLYTSGAGEEYLSRLVHASEESAAQARILKDALVGELSAILERLTRQQIEAAAAQQASLEQNLVTAIDQGLSAPLSELAQGLGQFRAQQGQELTQGLQDSMAAFADKLDRVLGGQVGQAKELQQQTLMALEKAVSAGPTISCAMPIFFISTDKPASSAS